MQEMQGPLNSITCITLRGLTCLFFMPITKICSHTHAPACTCIHCKIVLVVKVKMVETRALLLPEKNLSKIGWYIDFFRGWGL